LLIWPVGTRQQNAIFAAVNELRKQLMAIQGYTHAGGHHQSPYTYCELVRRLKKLWTTKVELTVLILEKDVPLIPK